MSEDPYKYFRVEARELLEGMQVGVESLAAGGGAAEIARLLRLAHTLKGAARVVRQAPIAECAHAIEGLLVPWRANADALPREALAELRALLDRLGAELPGLGASLPARKVEPAPEREAETVRVDVTALDALLERLTEGAVQMAGVREQTERIGAVRLLAREVLARCSGAGDRLLQEIAGELAGALDQSYRDARRSVDQAERELAASQEHADHLRLLPASLIFEPLARAVADAAQTVGKAAEFVGTGGEVRLDSHAVPLVRDALVQVVRNAVAHGIETPRERLRAGKAERGRVAVHVEQRGTTIVFRCCDDGRGLDAEALRRLAILRGSLPADAAPLTPGEVADMLLGGGWSTSGGVDEVSGRGVGLTVVREVAARLQGVVRLETTAGKGTTVELSAGVSLASVPVLLTSSGGFDFAIPTEAVRGTRRVRQDELTRSGGVDHVVVDGEMIPFTPLREVLGLEEGGRTAPVYAVIVERGRERAAIGVDHLHGMKTVPTRRIPAVAAADEVYAGAGLDASGTPVPVLDPDGLLRARAGVAPGKVPQGPRAVAPILVIDDSLTTRMLEQSILEAAGYQVEVAGSAEEALSKAATREYSLFLVDVEMPGMDGFSFVERTRLDAALRSVPSILVTSRSAPDDRRRGAACGAAGYMIKSEFDQGALLASIARLVAR